MKERAQWLDSGTKAHWDAAKAPPLEGVDAAFFVWEAGRCNKTLGQELFADEDKLYEAVAKTAEDRELEAWKRFKVFEPVSMGAPSKAIVDTLWVSTMAVG